MSALGQTSARQDTTLAAKNAVKLFGSLMVTWGIALGVRLLREPKKVEVVSIHSHQFAQVPTLKSPDRITLLEEERISAFYAGGRMYADPKRLGPVL